MCVCMTVCLHVCVCVCVRETCLHVCVCVCVCVCEPCLQVCVCKAELRYNEHGATHTVSVKSINQPSLYTLLPCNCQLDDTAREWGGSVCVCVCVSEWVCV